MHRGVMDCISELAVRRMVLGKPAIEGESPVSETDIQRAVSKVPRDTWNLVGIRGDHPPKAKYSLVTDSA